RRFLLPRLRRRGRSRWPDPPTAGRVRRRARPRVRSQEPRGGPPEQRRSQRRHLRGARTDRSSMPRAGRQGIVALGGRNPSPQPPPRSGEGEQEGRPPPPSPLPAAARGSKSRASLGLPPSVRAFRLPSPLRGGVGGGVFPSGSPLRFGEGLGEGS